MPRAIHIVCGLVAAALLGLAEVRAQIPPPPQSCSTGSDMKWLEGRDTRAPIYNSGTLFLRDGESPIGHRDGSGLPQLVGASLWIGALFDGFLFMAGSMLGPEEFWPGPLDDDGLPSLDCRLFDRIFEVTRDDIISFDESGVATSNLLSWPAWGGAPVVDGDGNPDNYDLDAGDRPALLGDHMLWWVMNDRGGPHEASQAIPLQVQVEVSAFAFDLPGVLGRTTFYRYRFKRRGIFPFVQAHVGLYVFAGVGNLEDDYIGADTLRSMGYAYNADNFDDDGYGEAPPAVGVGILRGSGPDLPDGVDGPRSLDTRRMTSFLGFDRVCDVCNPYPDGPGVGFYNMMRGRWPWGEQVTVGPGFVPPVTTPVMYPGNPGEFWSEGNLDGNGTAATPGLRKMVVSTGPFTLVPGAYGEVVFAVVTSRGTDNYDSVRQLREDMAFVQDRTTEILTPIGAGLDRSQSADHPLAISEVWPNPANSIATMVVSLPEPMLAGVEVFDMLGRRVAHILPAELAAGRHELSFETAHLAPGIYGYRVQAGRFPAWGSLVVAR